MEKTAMQDLLERFGHLIPDVEEEYLEKEKNQLCKMYIQGRNDKHLDYYPEKHANEIYNELFG
jgi:hypothetical protein